ncbi:MAG TPA: RDD family protein [Steroidobacteraceae bacterium]|nr:RDD family protein [Steroidobacteraceae bacterium]
MSSLEASDTTPALVIDSATGVDVHLRVAGPGARAAAFVLDWVIRLILAASWYVIAAVIYNRRFDVRAPLVPSARWFVAVLAPSVAIYFLYHYVLEVAMRGRTPGKRMVGVRIVTRSGSTPSVGALLARNVFRLIDSFPFAYTVGLITTMVTRDHVRVGDLAAGTFLVYASGRAQLPALPAANVANAAQAELIGELLQRWEQLAPEARRRLARRILDTTSPDTTSPDAPRLEDDGALRGELERLMTARAS